MYTNCILYSILYMCRIVYTDVVTSNTMFHVKSTQASVIQQQNLRFHSEIVHCNLHLFFRAKWKERTIFLFWGNEGRFYMVYCQTEYRRTLCWKFYKSRIKWNTFQDVLYVICVCTRMVCHILYRRVNRSKTSVN